MSILPAFRAKYSPVLKIRRLSPKKATEDTRRRARIARSLYPLNVGSTPRVGERSRRVRSNQYGKGIARPAATPQSGKTDSGNSTPQHTSKRPGIPPARPWVALAGSKDRPPRQGALATLTAN